MNYKPEPKAMTAEEQADTLRRILNAVEKGERKRWVDTASVLVLALATMASAWCAYQSTLWGGVQTFRLAAAIKEGREAATQSVAALETRGLDASQLITYLDAHGRGDTPQKEFLYQRFRPEMRKAFDAWLKTDPFRNPQAPPTPFRMAEYVQPEDLAAKRHQAEADQMEAAAVQANQTSDRYVLLTVLFSIVLFFGGISGTFQSGRLQGTAVAISALLFVVTVLALGTMPICKE